ncbi:MAG: MGMT family protein [Porticoccaceae bacterium]
MSDDIDPRTQVYQVISQIPPGRLCSYGRVAALAGLPGRARWVGTLLGRLPSDSTLPWYRVVNSSGRISFPDGSPDHQRQLAKLIAEGSADSSGKVLWRQCRWPD